jgi:tetratricopeptide (TPR) repeat protein
MRKYLDLTDKSFDSRYRYAQFLLYAEDWATLQKELETLKTEPNNPKNFVVTRMLGYSAIQNKNFDQGVKYMNELFARKQDASRILGSDYLYLGKALSGLGNDSLALINISKGVELDTTKVDELAAIGQKYYTARQFDKAADIYHKVISLNSKSTSMAMNLYYEGLANYWHYALNYAANKAPDRSFLVKADTAFAQLSVLAPEYEPAYLSRARALKYLDMYDNKEEQKGLAVPLYEKYVELVTVTKPEKATANSKNLVDAYINLGVYASTTDKEKAKEYFSKALALDPANATASENLKILNTPAEQPKKAPVKK